MNSDTISSHLHRGFTLIEVMIALVIVSIVLPALLMTMGTILDGLGHMENKTHAYWLAENKMQEVKLEKQLRNQLPKGKTTDQEEYIEREWDIEMEATEIDYEQFDAKMIKVDVRVKPSDSEHEGWLATLTGYIDAAPEKPFSGLAKNQNETQSKQDGDSSKNNEDNNSQDNNNQDNKEKNPTDSSSSSEDEENR